MTLFLRSIKLGYIMFQAHKDSLLSLGWIWNWYLELLFKPWKH